MSYQTSKFLKALKAHSYLKFFGDGIKNNLDFLDEFQLHIIENCNFLEGFDFLRKNDFVNAILITSEHKKGYGKSTTMLSLCRLISELYAVPFDREKFIVSGKDLVLQPELLKVVFENVDLTDRVLGIDEIQRSIPQTLPIHAKEIVGARAFAGTARKLGMNFVGTTPHESYVKLEFRQEAINWIFKNPRIDRELKTTTFDIFFVAFDSETRIMQQFFIEQKTFDFATQEDYDFLRNRLDNTIFSPESLDNYKNKTMELVAMHKKKKNNRLLKTILNKEYITEKEIFESLELFKETELKKLFPEQKQEISKLSVLKKAGITEKELEELL